MIIIIIMCSNGVALNYRRYLYSLIQTVEVIDEDNFYKTLILCDFRFDSLRSLNFHGAKMYVLPFTDRKRLWVVNNIAFQ